MSKYPDANQIMSNLKKPSIDEIRMVEEYIDGKNDYPENAGKLGEATYRLCRLADFIKYFLERKKMKTKVYFGKEADDTAYLHGYNQIHLKIPSILAGLHEVGHAIYGRSELDACTYSTAILLKTKQMKDQIPMFINHKLINLEIREE